MKNKVHITKKFLIKEYIRKNKSTIQIAKLIKCSNSTIFYYLKKFKIKKRKKKYKKILTKQFLIREYLKNNKSTTTIAKMINAHHSTIINYLKRYNIPRRNSSQAQKGLFKGKKNYFYTNGNSLRKNCCIDCKKKINYRSQRCLSCYYIFLKESGIRKLKNNYNWQGGKSFEPYPLGWTKTFKEQIRFRDKYKCQICGCPEVENGRRLDVHHIDYNKKNLNSDNLIALCKSCHTKTNYNRAYWESYFKKLVKEADNVIKIGE